MSRRANRRGAHKLATVADLLAIPEERVQLVGGEIVRRPMARGGHGMVQGATHDELSPFQRRDGPGGWWIATEISVAYEAHECPSHGLADLRQCRRWRKALRLRDSQSVAFNPDLALHPRDERRVPQIVDLLAQSFPDLPRTDPFPLLVLVLLQCEN